MSLTISVYDTFTQADQLLVEVPENNLLQTRYFPCNEARDTFASKDVVLDFDEGDLKQGAFVKKGYINGNTTSYRSTAEEPPRIGIEDTVDPKDLDRKLFESLAYGLGEENRADAYEDLKRVKVMRQVKRVQRSIEKTIVNVLLNNGVKGSIIDDASNPSDVSAIDISYYDTSEGNIQRFKPSVAWSPSGAAAGTCTPYDDICQMVHELVEHGGRAEDVLLSPQAWLCLIKDPSFKDQFETYHTKDMIMVGEEVQDARRVANANFNGYMLDVIVYSGCYIDDNGAQQQYLPKGFVCVLAPDCGRTLAGGCVQLAPQNSSSLSPMNESSFVARRGLFIASEYRDFNNQNLYIRVESRPLPAPRREWMWITADMMNTNDISAGTSGKPVVALTFSCEDYDDAVLPSDLENQIGGSKITIADATSAAATAASKTFDGYYIDGVKLTKDANNKYTVPNVDSELVAVFA